MEEKTTSQPIFFFSNILHFEKKLRKLCSQMSLLFDDVLQDINMVSDKGIPANIRWASRRLEDVFKTCLEDVFNKSSA